jgi:hypothetical protein
MERKNMILPQGVRTGKGHAPRILISVPPNMRAEVSALAAELGISESEAARRLIDLGVRARHLGLTSSAQ